MLVVFEAMSRRVGAVVNDDVLFGFRLRLFSLAAELGPEGVTANAVAPGSTTTAMLDASATAKNTGSRNNVFGEGFGAANKGLLPASSGTSVIAAMTTTTSAETISQISWPGAIISRMRPPPTLPAMKATDPHSRTGP